MNSIILSPVDIDRIIEMAWEDRTPFEAIKNQFELSETEVIELMRRQLKPSSFRMWRKRVHGRNTKHNAIRSAAVSRFRCKLQKQLRKIRLAKDDLTNVLNTLRKKEFHSCRLRCSSLIF